MSSYKQCVTPLILECSILLRHVIYEYIVQCAPVPNCIIYYFSLLWEQYVSMWERPT